MFVGMTTKTSSPRPALSWTYSHSALVLWPVLLVLVMWPTITSLIGIWASSPGYTHGFYIAPISLAIIWWQCRGGELPILSPSLSATALVIPMAVIMSVGKALDINLLQHIGFVGLLILGMRAMIGPVVFKRHLFAFAFLGFMIPFGDDIVPLLQHFTADFIVLSLRLFNIPVLDDGIFLTTPAGQFEVAQACAGLRFILATIMVGTLFSWVSFKSMKKRLVYVGLCLIVPVIANAIRATLIVLIATWTNKEDAVGFDHLVYGWGFFALIMIVLLGLGTRYADRSLDDLTPIPVVQHASSSASPITVLAILSGIAMITRLSWGYI